MRTFDDQIYQDVADGDVAKVAAHLDAADGRGDLRKALEERGSSRGRSLLHVAAMTGQIEVLRMLVEDYGANIGIRSLLGRDTPLHLAAQNGHRYACFVLIQYGASADLPNKFGATPLHWLNQSSEDNCARGGAECLEALLAAGADINATCDASTPLSEAACRVHPSLQLFLNAGADVNFRNRQLYGSCTALEMVIDTTSLNPWDRDSRRHVYPTLLRAGSELPRAQFMEAMRQ